MEEDREIPFKLINAHLPSSSHLERVAIDFKGYWKWPDRDPVGNGIMSNFIVNFVSKMTHLVCCILVFRDLYNPALIEEVNRRIMNEILPSRPSLYFYLGTKMPQARPHSNIPLIHFHDMVDPINYVPPPTF